MTFSCNIGFDFRLKFIIESDRNRKPLEEISMSIHLKRTVFFFCILCLGLGCCLGKRADAEGEDEYKTWITNLTNKHGVGPTRKISGFVLEDGIGLAGVRIYDKTAYMTDTNIQGYYEFVATHFGYTLIPQKICYEFTPPSLDIPANQYDQKNNNFTARKLAMVTISGNVKEAYTTNPFTATMEAYEEDGALFSRIVTDVDGNYSIPVCFNWTGWVKPFSLQPGIWFNPEKIHYASLIVNRTQQNYMAMPPKEPIISGSLSWKYSTSDPLPIVVIKFYAQDGSYFRSATTGVDGKYTLSVPFDWTGSVKPDNLNFVFDPDKATYSHLQADVVQNFKVSKKP
jgi:hypothetical protein